MIHNVSHKLRPNIKQFLFKHRELNRDELHCLLSLLISNINQVITQLVDCSLVRTDRVVLISILILLEQTGFATLGPCANNVTQFLRHLPETAVVVEDLLNLLDLLGDIVGYSVDLTRLRNSVDIRSSALISFDWGEEVFLVDVD